MTKKGYQCDYKYFEFTLKHQPQLTLSDGSYFKLILIGSKLH